jgi:tetratricopeptide (TPR) repeat protein
MAYFTAREDQPAGYCQDQVRGCAIYVGLIGLRYGTPVRDQPEVSYTELEFQTAADEQMTRLVFVLDENAALPIPPARLLDDDPGLVARQRKFRDRLMECGVTVAKVATPEQLEVLLLQALNEFQPHAAQPATRQEGVGLPARPEVFGRELEVASLVGAWLAMPPEPVAVLGAPGIGKSTICLAGLYDDRVIARFGGRRWFVRCDGATSAETVVSGLAAELGVTGDGAGSVLGQVCQVLGGGLGLVVLDNFETPWQADPLPVEDLLHTLAGLRKVGVVISARGTARPAGLRWRDFAMLSPLPLAEARRLFLAVAGSFSDDPRLDELLTGLDGVPLAVELMGYAAQGQPGLGEVVARWQAERTAMLTRMGGERRELSVPVSIEASITCPLMTSAARRLLGLLGVLPDGIARDALTALLPQAGLAAAAVLRQLGLAFDEGDRLRTLAPIREYVATAHPPEPGDLHQAAGHYAQLAASAGDQVGRGEAATAIARLQAETGNLTTMLNRAAADGRTQELTSALEGLAKYWRFTGYTQPQLAQAVRAAIIERGTPSQQARTWYALGTLALRRSDHLTARTAYEQALPLYQQVGDVLGEANCIQGLGNIALARSDHGAARAAYEQALPLYQEVGSVLGEANCIQRLGDIALRRSDHLAARTAYEQALPLYQQVGDVLGEANCIQSLGDIALRRSDHGAARAAYEQALPLFQQVGDVLGEANCIKGLGDIAQDGSDHEAARTAYEQALPLFQQVGSVLGEANCIQSLGDIALARSDHGAARMSRDPGNEDVAAAWRR